MAMLSTVDRNETGCPRCTGALTYQLGVNDGGGFRYDVWCPQCGDVLFAFSPPPLVPLPIAA